MLYDTDINYYFRLNFAGFVQIIDALGGITVDSDYDFTTQNSSGYHFTKGPNQVMVIRLLLSAAKDMHFLPVTVSEAKTDESNSGCYQ